MKITSGISSDFVSIELTVETPMLRGNFASFEGMLLNDSKTPKGVTVTKIAEDISKVSIPVMGSMDSGSGIRGISINAADLEKISNTLQRFIKAGLGIKRKKTVIVPLKGAKSVAVQDAINSAVRDKKNILLIDDQKLYLRGDSSHKQYEFIYGESEYLDLVLLANKSGNLISKLTKLYEPKLHEQDWY